MPRIEQAILIDTHVWVWLLENSRRLGRRSAEVIETAAGRGRILVSIISVWEIGVLVSKGRLKLAVDVETWIEQALTAPGILLANLTPSIALDSTRLPEGAPHDPADRILIATARKLGADFMTADRAIAAYGPKGQVRVLRAGR
jgi:PIN domain nuclease of toxin-antitoxin system